MIRYRIAALLRAAADRIERRPAWAPRHDEHGPPAYLHITGDGEGLTRS